MQYPVEFMTGIMTTSAVFITMAGIVIGLAKTALGKRDSILLFLSLAFGALAVTSSLSWFNTASDYLKLLALLSLLIQFFILWLPFIRLLGLIERR